MHAHKAFYVARESIIKKSNKNNKHPSPRAYDTPGTTAEPSAPIISDLCNYHTRAVLLSPFYRRENKGSDKFRDLAKEGHLN